MREYVDSFPRSVKQYEIAEKLGISDVDLSTYLSGKAPKRETALRLHREFGIDLEGLLDPESVGAP